ncbi:hypothetical protein M422DRAFT_60383 [Sphaerobolus stellatus SS14]|uniref:Phosphoglycerate mutase family protein n=1 Tax=Sphaerobolus stellatus (strain SS14) TaxID=990650 RepID=A0A0C9VV21_SPHS4|nr:hypothetical protein M422DRAFT_60383 [Sphaerobolus stellatus SS14]
MLHLKSILLFSLLAVVYTKKISNTVYIIRHGEKPDDNGQGLSPQGEERAQCLTGVFGPSSPFDIGYILAEQPQSNGDRTRPLETVTPLAEELGLTVDTSCDRDDSKCVADAVDAFAKNDSTKNILICWEHDAITDIEDSLGVSKTVDYPSDSFNLIFTIQQEKLVDTTQSENCTGLDN